MTIKYLDNFHTDTFVFHGAYAFVAESKVMLLSKFGTSIIIDKKLFQSLSNCKINDDAMFKLFQRGFATAHGKERVLSSCNEVIRPSFFMIDFTTKCNMSCVYCLRHFEGVGKTISEQVLRDICNYIVNYCKMHGVRNISFQPWGGEPLLALEQILLSKKIFDENNICARYSIQTNGLLIDKMTYSKLQSNNISFGISIDGNQQAHDAHRVDVKGNVTHSRIKQNIEQIREIDPQMEICTISVNSKLTLEQIESSIDYLIDELGLSRLKFNLVRPSGADSFDSKNLLDEQTIPLYVERLLNALVIHVEKGKTCHEVNISDKLLNLLLRQDGDICHSEGCQGGRRFVSFGMDGKIYPCELIGSEQNCLGSIYDKVDLVKLIQDSISTVPYFTEKHDEKCKVCPYWYYCRGGCYSAALSYGKKAGEVDDIECAVNRALYPKLIELILTKPKVAERLTGNKVSIRSIE